MRKVTEKSLTSRSATQLEVAVIAVYLLGGANRAVDTEDAAIKCHELAPNVFSWQKHKEQINLELVRVSLSDAKKVKYSGLLDGSGREGWRLTSRGVAWMASTGQSLLARQLRNPSSGHSRAGSIDTVRRERERGRLRDSAAWQSWLSTGAVDLRTAREVFRIDEYTTPKMLSIKVARLRATFEGDEEMNPFLSAAESAALKEKDVG